MPGANLPKRNRDYHETSRHSGLQIPPITDALINSSTIWKRVIPFGSNPSLRIETEPTVPSAMTRRLVIGFLTLAASSFSVHAKQNLEGCTTTTTLNSFSQAVTVWYLPDTGEVCEILDCGGGRAPVKYTVPGCAAYTGTETYSPSFLTFSTDTPSETSTANLASTTEAALASPQPAQTGMSTVGPGQATNSPGVTSAASATSVLETRSATATDAPATQTTNAASGLALGSRMVAGVVAAAGVALL
ncbi:hypothetical protein CIHG_01597 [Coccidioides immitis H538.4]|uniref:Uncharacterized protein n=2 Tax=Coccidioides immitis TaxID=5501 RepID=A0A0J8U9Q6_COCIT|nr:hypothetical protein CIRG_01448 [Coccidioides immitis RMSCC 2394]KMU83813.1 hypothetical protein CIHG_01597 [Coccidioides immitis H538.4]